MGLQDEIDRQREVEAAAQRQLAARAADARRWITDVAEPLLLEFVHLMEQSGCPATEIHAPFGGAGTSVRTMPSGRLGWDVGDPHNSRFIGADAKMYQPTWSGKTGDALRVVDPTPVITCGHPKTDGSAPFAEWLAAEARRWIAKPQTASRTTGTASRKTRRWRLF
ncbi:hypothetical protein [Kribbella sp. NBC_00889]|uniref:hypothetical protein n=1 Tax=Kribbella sp. NBC_00889 TaxID=2975974 RepID=UPI00386AFDEF|nr:hypothetical protein OG817_29700 [Kribbella sp. NBC_00889]